MSKYKAIPLAFIVAVVMSGCAKTAPKCASDETVGTVIQIVKEEVKKSLGDIAAGQFKISLNTIRTSDFNKSTGKQSCAATLSMKAEKEMVLEITYTSELTEKSGEYYVTVDGLDWDQASVKPLDPKDSEAAKAVKSPNNAPSNKPNSQLDTEIPVADQLKPNKTRKYYYLEPGVDGALDISVGADGSKQAIINTVNQTTTNVCNVEMEKLGYDTAGRLKWDDPESQCRISIRLVPGGARVDGDYEACRDQYCGMNADFFGAYSLDPPPR